MSPGIMAGLGAEETSEEGKVKMQREGGRKGPKRKKPILQGGKKGRLMCKAGGCLGASFNDIKCLYFNQKG